jgi:hypothetical protein
MRTERDHILYSPADLLAEEIARYLAAVDVFRREGCEPQWRDGRAPDPRRSQDAASAP